MIAFLRLALLALAGYLAFAPAAEAQSTYRIRAGDVLRVEVIEDPTLNRSVLVSPDGRIAVPLAGTVQAGGRTIEQVQAALTTRLAPTSRSRRRSSSGSSSCARTRRRCPCPRPRTRSSRSS